MTRRFAVLLSADGLAPRFRWRLVATLFAQRRTLVEGSLAIAMVEIVCWLRTGQSVFLALAVYVALVTTMRILLARRFERRERLPAAGAETTPEFWASWFVAGGAATASAWTMTNTFVFFGSHDAVTQMFVIMVETGWISASNARNASSPAAVMLQTSLTAISVALCSTFGGTGITAYIAPFALVVISTSVSMAAFVRGQTAETMLAEQQLADANARLTQLSATDGLTGIGNRRAFDTSLQTEWARAAREASDLGLLLIDVDHFKLFNDRYGHPAGDDCLRLIAEVTERILRRPPDIAARFGGEEFVVLLPGTAEHGARDVAERLCRTVMAMGVLHEGSRFGAVTVSIGVASMAPRQGDDAQALIDLADQALYAAKQAGRNRVCVGGERPKLPAWQKRDEQGAAAPAGDSQIVPGQIADHPG